MRTRRSMKVVLVSMPPSQIFVIVLSPHKQEKRSKISTGNRDYLLCLCVFIGNTSLEIPARRHTGTQALAFWLHVGDTSQIFSRLQKLMYSKDGQSNLLLFFILLWGLFGFRFGLGFLGGRRRGCCGVRRDRSRGRDVTIFDLLHRRFLLLFRFFRRFAA